MPLLKLLELMLLGSAIWLGLYLAFAASEACVQTKSAVYLNNP